MGQVSSEKKIAVRSAGRPRSLALDDVLDAAIELGLGGISMTALAAKLGVGTATIYTYVASRGELVRLAAARHGKRPRLDDLGEHWTDLIRSHARRTFELCAAEPHLIVQHMQGLMGPDMHVDYLESMLAALVRRGFTLSEAYRLYSSVNTVIFGAVVRSAYARALEAQGHGHEGAVRRSLAERALAELPHVRACEEFADSDRAFAYLDTLERVIESFAQERGERQARDQRSTRRTRSPRRP